MSRYFSKPRCAPDGHWDDPMLPQISVSEHVSVNTGIVNHRGEPIMRAPEALGFHHPRQRQ